MPRTKKTDTDQPKKKRVTKKKQDQEVPEVEVNDIEFDATKKGAKDKYKQLRWSNFYITLNTNQRFNELSEEYQIFNNKFKQVIDQLSKR